MQRFTGRRGYKWNAGNDEGTLSTDEDESTMDPVAFIVSRYPICMHRYCCGYFKWECRDSDCLCGGVVYSSSHRDDDAALWSGLTNWMG